MNNFDKLLIPLGAPIKELKSCNSCFLKAKCKRCPVCRNAWYCSKKCQKNDWKSHKKYCKSFCEEDGVD